MPEDLMPETVAADRLVLAGPLTVRSAEQTRDWVMDALGQQACLVVDCQDVTEVDLSFIQLMLSARKSAIAAGKTLSLARPAEGPLRDALLQAGLIGTVDGHSAADQTFWLNKETADGQDDSHR